MADQFPVAGDGRTPGPAMAVRDERGDLSADFIAAIAPAIDSGDVDAVRRMVGSLHEADVGDLLEALEPEQRTRLIKLLGDDFDFTALTELDETLRVQILEELPPKTVAEGVRDLESDDAVTILEDLEPDERAEVLAQLPPVERIALARGLEYPEDSAGRLMQTEFIAGPPFWTVGRAIDYMREAEDLPDEFYRLFVVDPGYRLVGTVALDRLLRSKRPVVIGDITEADLYKVHATDDQEDVARLFERYNLVTAAVVDDADRLVGVITVDDIVDVIEEEADEDIRRLAGLGDEEVSDTVAYIARSRIPWLLVNIVTAFLAAGVIGLFGGTIERMVALAVLMPIVASMGGNAGTQAMTVTVRAIATRDIAGRRAARVIGREVMVGLINGVAVAACVGVGAGLWFQNVSLGVVIAAALIVNLLVAGLVGATVPLLFDRLKIDPAVASGVLLTAITDVTGFFVFLGLAGWWFGLL
ncbi:MAG: magnesium transporter [Bauldia sp.]|nr:MAG: magnesium transporter [Bauldia sp.]